VNVLDHPASQVAHSDERLPASPLPARIWTSEHHDRSARSLRRQLAAWACD
jgi:hypothetical protein